MIIKQLFTETRHPNIPTGILAVSFTDRSKLIALSAIISNTKQGFKKDEMWYSRPTSGGMIALGLGKALIE